MITVEQHVQQWKHNRRFAQTIDSKYRDWQITVIFYTALHLIDAGLASLSVPVSDHPTRNEQVRSNASFAPVRDQYLTLYRISRVTRYDCDPDKWIPEEYLDVPDLVNQLLQPIENVIGPMIKKFAKLDPEPLKVQS